MSMMRSVAVVMLFSLLGSRCEQQARLKHEEKPAPAPSNNEVAFYVWRFPGYPGPDSSVSKTLAIVVYVNGTLQRLRDRADISSGYVEGVIPADDFKKAFALLGNLKREKAQGIYEDLVVDTASERLYVCGDGAWQVQESLPRRNSSLGRLLDHLFTLQLTNPKTIPKPTTLPT